MNNKNLPVIVVGTVAVLLLILGIIFWQKSQVKSNGQTVSQDNSHSVKKVDMASQPKWVQDLSVSAVKGIHKGTRGLDNVVVTINNIPEGMVDSLTYTMSYSYQGGQGGSGGFFTDTPVKLTTPTSFARTFDFGTCSTNSCVRHDGVSSLDVEIDFTTTKGDQPVWSGTVPVK